MSELTAVSVGSPWPARIPFLPALLFEPRRPALQLIVGWLLAFVPSVLLAALVSQIFPGLGQPDIPIESSFTVFLLVVFAPAVETLVMAAVLAILLKFLPALPAVALSAVGWGLAHSIAAPAWGLVIWWPFLIFSILFVTWRQRSLLAALAMPAAVHALQNLLPALLVLAGNRA